MGPWPTPPWPPDLNVVEQPVWATGEISVHETPPHCESTQGLPSTLRSGGGGGGAERLAKALGISLAKYIPTPVRYVGIRGPPSRSPELPDNSSEGSSEKES